MAINPRKIKKRPAKDLKPGDLRSQILEKGKPTPAKDLRSNDPKSLRNKALREANRAANENKPRPAKDIKAGGSRAQFLKDVKAGTIKAKGPSVGARVGRGLLKKVPVVGAAIGFIADASPAGEGSDKPSGPLMKGNNMKPTFPKGKGSASQPRAKVSSTTGTGRPEYPSSNKMKSGSSNIRKTASGTYTKSYDVKTKKSSTASTAATSAAASDRKRPSTRYQRNELAMEQRKRSSSGQRKSILSLFRKG